YCLEMAPAIQESGHGRLLGGVLLYACVITLMLWLALGRLVAPGPLPFRPGLVASAAVLFYLSDGILAYCYFVRTWRWRDVAVMLPYFAAQYLFAAAVAFPPA
ncbi:MAG: lysoplasmalogenase family protein, partial [Mycobacterium leprae]